MISIEKPLPTEFINLISENKTSVFIGPSGVGKSTLVNRLVEKDIQKVNQVSLNTKGKHTTTNSKLLVLKNQSGFIIDTPGLKSIGIWEQTDSDLFSDITNLISQCKFKNCTHRNEPGCQIQRAIENYDLDEARFKRYLSMQRE